MILKAVSQQSKQLAANNKIKVRHSTHLIRLFFSVLLSWRAGIYMRQVIGLSEELLRFDSILFYALIRATFCNE